MELGKVELGKPRPSGKEIQRAIACSSKVELDYEEGGKRKRTSRKKARDDRPGAGEGPTLESAKAHTLEPPEHHPPSPAQKWM